MSRHSEQPDIRTFLGRPRRRLPLPPLPPPPASQQRGRAWGELPLLRITQGAAGSGRRAQGAARCHARERHGCWGACERRWQRRSQCASPVFGSSSSRAEIARLITARTPAGEMSLCGGQPLAQGAIAIWCVCCAHQACAAAPSATSSLPRCPTGGPGTASRHWQLCSSI